MRRLIIAGVLLLSAVAPTHAQTGYVVNSPCSGPPYDDTAAIVLVVNQANQTGGVVSLPAKGSTCTLTQPITLQTGVVLEGGCAAGGSPNQGLPERWCTKLLWTGPQSGWPVVVSCGSNALNCGVRNLLIDCAGGNPTASTCQGVYLPSNLNFTLQDVTVINARIGMMFGGDPANQLVTANAAPRNLHCWNAGDCYYFYGMVGGQHVSPATDIHGQGLYCWFFQYTCVHITSSTDDIHFDGGFIASTAGNGAVAFLFNSDNGPLGTASNSFDNFTIQVVPGDQFVVCNTTNGGHLRITGLFISAPSPTINPGCLLTIQALDRSGGSP
ncbi:MAG: hypothetical protein JO328_12765 [Hyphomicrobiales bacterium]|nr:hypothetical protein [Hyphomicrobiales bacterium]